MFVFDYRLCGHRDLNDVLSRRFMLDPRHQPIWGNLSDRIYALGGAEIVPGQRQYFNLHRPHLRRQRAKKTDPPFLNFQLET